MTITTLGAYIASSNTANPLSIGTDFTNSGSFTHSSGKVVFNTTTQTDLSYSAATSFYQFYATTPGKTLVFDKDYTTNVGDATGGALHLQGTNCTTNKVTIRSELTDTQFTLNVNTNVTDITVEYVDLKDSNLTGKSITASNSIDSLNNSVNWTINSGVCGGASSALLTAWSFQRKTFYDAGDSVYWRFSYSGSDIDISYNAQPWTSSWTEITSLAHDTNDFSVWDNDTYVFIAFRTTTPAIQVRRGTLNATSISWDTAYTALSGGGGYNYASISQDSAGYVWVAARHGVAGTPDNYYMQAVRSSSVDDPSSWGSLYDVSATSETSTNVYGVIVPLNTTSDMYLVFNRAGTNIEGCRWDNDHGGGARWENSSDQACPTNVDTVGTGQTGLDKNLSVTTDSEKDVHVLWVDNSSYIQSRKYDESTSAWAGTTYRVDNGAAVANSYATVSFDSGANNVYALYLRNSVIYYNSWGEDSSPTTTNEAEATNGTTNWTEGTSPTYLTSNYSDSGRIFAEWTSGSGSPFTLNWDYIIIPEKLLYLLGLGILIPLILRKKKSVHTSS